MNQNKSRCCEKCYSEHPFSDGIIFCKNTWCYCHTSKGNSISYVDSRTDKEREEDSKIVGITTTTTTTNDPPPEKSPEGWEDRFDYLVAQTNDALELVRQITQSDTVFNSLNPNEIKIFIRKLLQEKDIQISESYERGFNAGHAKERWLKDEVEKEARKELLEELLKIADEGEFEDMRREVTKLKGLGDGN